LLSLADDGPADAPLSDTLGEPLGAGPHGGYSALTDQCAACHRTHTSQSSPLIISASTGNAFCMTCHDGTGASVPPYVSTHSNTDFSSPAEANFELQCTQCHDPHGSTNLADIRPNIRVTTSPLVTTGPVVFTALTGADSFDEDSGDGDDTDDLCVACHIHLSNPGFPTADHPGGDHTGGALGTDERNKDCTPCHPHDLDDNFSTLDGFMPSGGSCVACHKQTTGAIPRRQIVDSNGDGTGTGGDFLRSSHHVAGLIPTDADCEVCHEQTQHMAGTVRLYNADNAGTVYALDGISDDVDYEDHCLSCHDGDGALKEGTPLAPFSDAAAPPTIDTAAWGLASHNTAAAVGSCIDCHDNGHGSNKVSLLAPWNAPGTGPADDPYEQEEYFCYACHDTDGPAITDVQTQFGYTSHHIVAASEQTATSIVLECVSCHNPHTNTAAQKVSDPDDNSLLASNDNNFCLACHDGTPPASVSFGTHTVEGFLTAGAATVWDKSAYVGSAHDVGDVNRPNIQCADCHEHHGSNANYDPPAPAETDTNVYYDLLKGIYTRIDGDASYYPDNFTLCWSCHRDSHATLDDVIGDAWDGEHNSHDDDGPCIWCHDAHAPYDAGEFGLVNYYYANVYGDLLLQYKSGGNDIFTDLSTSFDPAAGVQCGITCHSTQHGSKNYTPADYDTSTPP
jgi:predicted CXXCH cytochrome family protein